MGNNRIENEKEEAVENNEIEEIEDFDSEDEEIENIILDSFNKLENTRGGGELTKKILEGIPKKM